MTGAASARAAELALAPRNLAPTGFTVGVIGRDVPRELIEAVGASAVALRGRAGVDLSPADALLGTGVDPLARARLAVLLEEDFRGLDAIAVSSDSEASLRTFLLLRELRRVDPTVPIPPLHLVDIAHLPRDSSRRYSFAKLREFASVLAGWVGSPLSAEALAAAIESRNDITILVRRLSALRWGPQPRLSGSDLAEAVLAGGRIPPSEHAALLGDLLADASDRPVVEGVPIVLSGSIHDEPGVIAAVENAGALVVAEDHDGGDAVLGPLTAETTLESLAERVAFGTPVATRSSIGDRARLTLDLVRASGATAVLSYSRTRDDSPRWDFSAQSRLTGVRARAIDHQAYAGIDAELLSTIVGQLAEGTHRG